MDNKGELLNQLRIDRNAPAARPVAPWIVGGIVLVALVAAAAAWWFAGSKAFLVDAVTAAAPAGARC